MFTGIAAALLLAAKLEFVVPDANFSLREGLPAVQVLCLYQDRYGALWAGTTAGLAQMGGPAIKSFGPSEGLSRSAVFAIAEEPSGAIVAGTAGGISRLQDGRFEPVSLPAAAANMGVRRFARGPGGALWALAGERMLLRNVGGEWHAVGIDGALAFEASDMAVDEMGALWLATRNHGLLRLIPTGTRLRKSVEFQPVANGVASIDHVATSQGKVYFTSSRGLSVLSVAAGGVVETTPFPPGLSAGHRALAVTPSGRVFVSTSAGVLSLDGRAFSALQSRNDRARSPAVALLSDREGQLWMGTVESGLHVLLMGRGVRFLRADKESFRTIDIDRFGVHWVSNESRVLAFRTDEQGTPIAVREARFSGFDSLRIYALAEDPDGGLVFAMSAGVGLLPAASRAAETPTIQPDRRFEVLRDRLVTGLFQDAQAALWAISPLGVYRLSRDRQQPENIPLPPGNPWMAAMDGDGGLWVTTRQGTLNVIDTASRQVTSVALPPGRHVEFVGAAPDGGVVATFENGRSAFFTARGGTPKMAFEGPEGLSWLSVLSLQKMGDYYLAAHEGDRLSQIRLQPGRVELTILTSADLEDSDFRYLSLREGRAGQMWFTLLNGIGLLEPNAPPPPGALHLEPDLPSIVLDPRPNSLEVHAELSDPVAPRKARYRHRLVGESDEWSEWSADSHIPLSNLAPGTYRLEVEAEDRYGRNPTGKSIEVVARAHFWESWPARIAAAFLAMAGVYGLYRRRMRADAQERLDLAAAVKAGRADLEVANQRLQELSLTDVLTGLRNRRYFSEVVEDEIRLLKRRFDERHSSGDLNRDAVFFLLDLDRFKTVNDHFGHAGGDAVLKETARRLEGLLRKTDRLIRWGGEEFLVLSLDCQRSQAADMAARMMEAISKDPYPVGPAEGIHITTSIGWAAYPFPVQGDEPHPEDVVRLADRALYRAKRAGRNCAVGILPASDGANTGGSLTGTVELLKDLGISVAFTLVRGLPRMAGYDLASVRESGSYRRPL